MSLLKLVWGKSTHLAVTWEEIGFKKPLQAGDIVISYVHLGGFNPGVHEDWGIFEDGFKWPFKFIPSY